MKSGQFLLSLAYLIFCGAPGLAMTHYVNLNNASPTSPYTNWPTAATNIQDAIDASALGDLILVTNGIYKTGSRIGPDATPCRVIVDKPVALRSLNGPEFTVIEGSSLPGSFPFSLNSIRCAYMTNGARLFGFMLSKGSVRATSYVNLGDPAGGVYCQSPSAVISNCIIINCASYIGGGGQSGTYFNCLITNCLGHIGGGAVFTGILDHCEVIWNTSHYFAGGLYLCQASNCLITYNLGLFGGGAYGGAVSHCTVYGNYADKSPLGDGGYGGGLNAVGAYNSIIYFNAAATGGNDIANADVTTNCCSPGLSLTSGNITNNPLFINIFDFPGNFHLQSNSPCINTGNNALPHGTTDFDRRPRQIGSKVDMGAYEFQGTMTNSFLTWLWNYYLLTDISADFADADGDGMNNWQEWKADTIPVNSSSRLYLSSVEVFASSNRIGWASVNTRKYSIERSTNFNIPASFKKIATNISGQVGTTFFSDTNSTGSSSRFYRVFVE